MQRPVSPIETPENLLAVHGRTRRGATGRPYGGRALADRLAERRRRFIEAGIEMFGRQGLRAATVRGVCNLAGLTDRYFYESFESMESLLQAVYLHEMGRLAQALQTAADELADGRARSPEPWIRVRIEIRRGLQIWFQLVREPTFARIVLNEVLGVNPAMDALYDACTREYAAVQFIPVQRHLPELLHSLSAGQCELIGRALCGSSLQIAKMWADEGYRLPIEAVIEVCLQVAMGTLKGLDAKALAKALPEPHDHDVEPDSLTARAILARMGKPPQLAPADAAPADAQASEASEAPEAPKGAEAATAAGGPAASAASALPDDKQPTQDDPLPAAGA